MRQFDVYPNPDSRERLPYLIVLQSDLLERLDNVVVAPLRSQQDGKSIPILGLNPVVEVGAERHFVRIQAPAAIPARSLRQPVCNLSSEREALLAALNLLFTGL
ncbi:CcdB family protein [Azovibrio restrictus]|uniref:CcdB family protein n=1 Tax=Azovibrio restrictus TaxID=146938 RepID=UPI0026EC1771|nr:CcdB family protein [Azovibrio restrictus]